MYLRLRLIASCSLAVVAISSSIASVALAENWAQWRGPHGNGISDGVNVPTTWSKTKNVLWRLPLPGPAGATPVLWENRLFLTSTDGDNLVLLCVDTDGKKQWQRTVSTGNKNVRGDEGNGASPSPCTDGKHVWAFMANGVLGCYTVDGKPVWKADVNERYGKLKIAFGMTSTPILDNGRLYLQLIHGEGNPKTREAIVVAWDAATGDEIWRHDRASDAIKECEHSYASPILYRDSSREFLVTHGADYVMGHDLKDGTELWRCGELNPKSNYNPTLRFVASPTAIDGLLVVPSAKNGPVFALRTDVSGDVTNDASAFHWKRPRNTPDVPSPLIRDGLVYLCRENGVLICMDEKTGEELYQERAFSDRYRASPIYADGKVFLTARKGVITVVKAGRKFEVLSVNKMEESTSASPVIAGNRVYIRTFDALYAIGE